MPLFSYKALDTTGKEITGNLDAANEKVARTRLREMGYRPFDLVEKKEGGFSIPFLGKKKIKGQELALFTRQLATLLDAGLPLLRSLNILKEQSTNPVLTEIIQSLSTDIQSGASFSESLAKHPDTFTKLYMNMVKAGEIGGVLETVLDRLATFAEKDQELKHKIKSASTYPAVMFTVATSVVIFLLTFVLPTFVKLFSDMGVTLPLPTRIVIGVSDFLRNQWYFLIAVGSGIYFFMKWWGKTEAGRFKIDEMKLKIPVFGELLRKVATARFTRTLGTLVQSGVPILQALTIVRETIGNELLASGVDKVQQSVSAGESISKPLHETKLFPTMVTHMIAVGEETGSLDNMLMRIADNYDMQVDETVAALSSLLEPLLILFMGGAIGTIVMALFFPMFELVNLVK